MPNIQKINELIPQVREAYMELCAEIKENVTIQLKILDEIERADEVLKGELLNLRVDVDRRLVDLQKDADQMSDDLKALICKKNMTPDVAELYDMLHGKKYVRHFGSPLNMRVHDLHKSTYCL